MIIVFIHTQKRDPSTHLTHADDSTMFWFVPPSFLLYALNANPATAGTTFAITQSLSIN